MRRVARLLNHVTPAGRAVALLAVLSWWTGRQFDWTELQYTALAGGVLLALGLVLVALPRPVQVELALHPAKTVVGTPAVAEVVLRPRLVPLVNPVVDVVVGPARVLVRLPNVLPGRIHHERLDVPAERRGVYPVGPVLNMQSDLLGFFRRRKEWAKGRELYVRPEVTMLEPLAAGLVNDLEGVPSEQLSRSDLAFHALREYVPGDDLRHVHWRSSAKADRLLVRQYLETRRSHATIVVDDDNAAYADANEFEFAVSIAASLALRALLDDFEVFLTCGVETATGTDVDTLLDATCRFERGTSCLRDRAARAAKLASGISFVAVVAGSRVEPRELHLAGAAFPGDAHRLILRADPAAPSRVSEASGYRYVSVSRLDHLSALLWRAM